MFYYLLYKSSFGTALASSVMRTIGDIFLCLDDEPDMKFSYALIDDGQDAT